MVNFEFLKKKPYLSFPVKNCGLIKVKSYFTPCHNQFFPLS